ncbi:MAG: TIGR04282 family arsenosugar biosynthesis glycosyltransferase [Pseudomonadota bacterium]
MAGHARTIIVFCKQAVPGQVKTRIATKIGDTEAARLAEELAHRTIRECVRAELVDVEVWQTPDLDDRFALPGVSDVRLQCTGDLGQRMQHALEQSMDGNRSVVLVGTDCPGIDARYLNEAFKQLDAMEAVIGPAEDGGFGLIGLTEVRKDLLSDIRWSQPEVFEAVSHRLAVAYSQWARLPLLWDVDRPEDLLRYRSIYGAASGRAGP